MQDAVRQALPAWREAIGSQRVEEHPDRLRAAAANVSAFERHIGALLYPESVEQVQAVVRAARPFRAPLYPISCGRNWGLGSRCPLQDGAAVLDLSRMNTIREVNGRHAYAVVEPGVTQQHMYERLLQGNEPLLLNVTGSGLHSSLLGNALERGGGYFASRAEALSGLEVVLGTGELLRTGPAHYPQAITSHVFKYGIGPQLDGLFIQSNLGIVTAAGIDMVPRSDTVVSVVATLPDPERLAELLDALADLRRQGVITSAIHVGNAHRTRISMSAGIYSRLRDARPDATEQELRKITEEYIRAEGFGHWSAVMTLEGSRASVRLACRELRAALRPLARVQVLSDGLVAFGKKLTRALHFLPLMERKGILLDAIEPLYRLAEGVPTDHALKSVFWAAGELPPADGEDLDPDPSPCGMLYSLPILPMDGALTVDLLDYVERTCREAGFEPAITVYYINTKAVELVISIGFQRKDVGQVRRAHELVRTLNEEYMRRGTLPYRVGLDFMDQVVDPADPYWQTVERLKDALDPDRVIAPGRYGP